MVVPSVHSGAAERSRNQRRRAMQSRTILRISSTKTLLKRTLRMDIRKDGESHLGIILSGILAAALIGYLIYRFDAGYELRMLLIIIAVVIVFVCLVVGLAVNTGGYYPAEEVQTYNLENLADQIASVGRGNLYYVSVSAQNVYTFYTRVNSEFEREGTKAYRSYSVSKNVTVIEEEECSRPRMVEYLYKPKISFWSFGIDSQITSYVFYVPEGTIIHEFSLGQP